MAKKRLSFLSLRATNIGRLTKINWSKDHIWTNTHFPKS